MQLGPVPLDPVRFKMGTVPGRWNAAAIRYSPHFAVMSLRTGW